MTLTPYRFVYSNGSQIVQFHETAEIALRRAVTLSQALYAGSHVQVYVDRGFFPLPPGNWTFRHAKEIA